MTRPTSRIMLMMLLVASALLADAARAQEGARYEVRITNLTRGQVITPPVVASHTEGFELFPLGAPAIPALAMLAEDGVVNPLLTHLSAQPEVFEAVAAAEPLPPGASVTVVLTAPGRFRRITAVGMLATSNDAFFGVRGAAVPRHGATAHTALAYDAGSEANSESCAFIPGPPCGNALVRDTAGAEGYVHVHAGIHGIGDLVPSAHDWRNPVAEVSVRRLR